MEIMSIFFGRPFLEKLHFFRKGNNGDHSHINLSVEFYKIPFNEHDYFKVRNPLIMYALF